MEEVTNAESLLVQEKELAPEEITLADSEGYFIDIYQMDQLDLSHYQKKEVNSSDILEKLDRLVPAGIRLALHYAATKDTVKIDIPFKNLQKAKGQVDKYRAFVKGKMAKLFKMLSWNLLRI